jgi:hypothetical protein
MAFEHQQLDTREPDRQLPSGTKELLYWIAEREAIRLRRAAAAPPPWTDDPILRDWRFCNVHREDDRVTRWVADNWREPNADNSDLWFAMVVARFVNLPASLAEIGFPVPWRPDHFLAAMAGRKARGETCYGAAYMIRANRPGQDKAVYQVESVFNPLWAARERLRPRVGQTLAEWHGRLAPFHGMGGGFMPAQVVADMKYVLPLSDAPDWMDFAASGPGSRRGLNRVLGRPVDAKWDEYSWLCALRRLQEAVGPELERIGIGALHAQDLQNCLCELDKYLRVRNGEGRPKQRFAA